MDGKGAWRDNVFVERFWRTIKYEEPHAALDRRTPDQAYYDPLPLRTAA
jgi:putative transposase